MKKLALALGLLLLPSLAWAQNPTCPTRPLGDNSNACASDQFVQNQIAASTTIVYIPATYGAKCDGVTDDTAAFQTMFATIILAHAGTIDMPDAGNCLIYNSGQALGTVFFQVQAVGFGGLTIHGHGSTFTDGHVYTGSDERALFNVVGVGNIRIDDLNFVSAHPGGNCPNGMLPIVGQGSANDIRMTNVSVTNGFGLIQTANMDKLYMSNVTSTNSCYGVNLLSGTSDITINNLVTSGVDRSLFVKDNVTNLQASVTSLNNAADDILLENVTNNSVMNDIRINYKSLARTNASTPEAYITILPQGATGSTFRKIDINVDVDKSGNTNLVKTVLITKQTAAALGTNFEDIHVHGRESGVPNIAGHDFDIFTSGDAPWTGETASAIDFSNLYVTGSTTPDFYWDFQGPANTGFTSYSMQDVKFPGNWAPANNSNQLTLLACINATFANFSCGLTVTGVSSIVGATTIYNNSFGLSGNISAPAWTTNGIRFVNAASTLTDTTSSGTVAAAYSSVFGGSTVAASSATTFTNYFGSYFKAPIAGTNVTFTNGWALGADNVKFGTSNSFTIGTTGVVSIGGATTITANGMSLTTTSTTAGGNAGVQITNFSSTGNASVLFNNDGGLIGGFFATGSASSAFGGVGTLNLATTTTAGVGLGTNNSLRAFISSAGGFYVGTTAVDAGSTNFQAAGTVRGNTGFSANGAAGVSTTCTETVGNTLVFTFGLLTTKGANCT